jgi:hypothetical protein
MTTKLKIGLGTMACACLAVTSAYAVPITLSGTSPNVLGDVNLPGPHSAVDDIDYINTVLGLSLGGSATVSVPGGSDTVYRSENALGSLTAATQAGNISGTSASITLTSGFEYLIARYPNGGLEIWDISSIAPGSTIDIPKGAFGKADDQYSLSGWFLFDPQSGKAVPDGGSAACLLGLGLFGLASMHRFLSRRA